MLWQQLLLDTLYLVPGTSKSTMDQRHRCNSVWVTLGNSKAIVWKEFQQAHVLEGHTASVWAVLAIEDDLILTGLLSLSM